MTIIGGTETVTVYARVSGSADRYGAPTYTWPTGVEIADVLVAPGTSTEGDEAVRSEVDTACVLYLPPTDIPIDARSRIVVRGRTWQVDGDVAVWESGTFDAGSVVTLSAVVG